MGFILLLLIASWYKKIFVVTEEILNGCWLLLREKNDICTYKELLKSYINIAIHQDPQVCSGFISEE